MEPIREVSGRAIPFGRKNVDTDVIIPAHWLKTVSREGMGRGAFESLRADPANLFDNPGHPYTKGLLGSIPHLDTAARSDGTRARLNEIKGMVPSLFDLPPGYRGDFHAAVKRLIARRLHLAPVFRRKLAPMLLQFANPAWIRDDAPESSDSTTTGGLLIRVSPRWQGSSRR